MKDKLFINNTEDKVDTPDKCLKTLKKIYPDVEIIKESKVKYLTPELVIKIHDRILRDTKSIKTIRDISLLESAVYTPSIKLFGEDMYPSIIDKACILLERIIKNHPFIDGNKRTALVSCILFLKLNGIIIKPKDYKEDSEFIDNIASSINKLENIQEWVESIIV